MSLLPSSAQWRELPRQSKSECPRLFYAWTKQPDGLTIRLTDLVAIWQCALQHDEIVEYAKNQHVSIDPSESNEQFHVLLDKLEHSVKSGGNHLFQAKEEDSQAVYLQTNLELPKPLKSLSWTFELRPRGAGELAEQLLRPCLHEASVAKQKLESLVRIIRDKDHVLSRLLERVESSHTDFSLIFPGITGLKSRKGRVTVSEAQKHVPGMAEFSTNAWSHGFDNDSPYSGFDEMGMTSLVIGCERCPNHTVEEHDDWLRHLPVQGSKAESQSLEPRRAAKRKTLKKSHPVDSSESENDFETQITPPHARKSRKLQNESGRTTSDAEESRPAKRPKLGRVGGSTTKKVRSSKDSENLTSPSDPEFQDNTRARQRCAAQRKRSKSRSSTASETETASESEISAHLEKPVSLPHKNQDTRQTGARKLGRLTSYSSHHSSSQSRSTTPAHQPDKDATTFSENPVIHKQTKLPQSTSELQSQSVVDSPSRRKSRLGSLRNTQPSQPQSQIQTSNTRPPSDSDTETDIDLDADTYSKPKSPPRRSKVTSHSASASGSNPTTPRKLGRLKRSNTNTNSEFDSNTPSRSRNQENDTRRSQSINDPAKITSPSPPSSPSPSAPKTKTVGNRSLQHRHSTSDSRSVSPVKSASDRENGQESEPKVKTKSSSPPSPAKQATRPAPAKQETAEEAANRRREELKSRLNTGGGGGGGNKKKRKF